VSGGPNRVARLGILSFTTVFPNPAAPHAGSFVASRLERLGELENVRVVAPVTLWDYRRLRGATEPIPACRRQGALEVFHPRWAYAPAGGAMNGFLLFLQSLPCVWRIGRRNFDVIDAHFGHPEAFAAALLAIVCRRPFVVTLRGSEAIHARYPLRRFFMGWALRRAARVIAVSERLRQLAVALGVDPLRTTKIPNGVDTSIFHPRDRLALRARLGFSRETRVVLTAGNLVWEKGHHRAIEALGALLRRGIRAELLIAGSPGREGGARYAEELRAAAALPELAGRVHFLGRVPPPALAEYMCAADVFCLASQREGWPNVVHESLACGTPAVCTDVGAVPDLIPGDLYGYVVPRDDQAALEAALARALDVEWDRAAIAARAGARTWDRVASEVLTEIESVAASRNGREAAPLSNSSVPL
jgi:teichuronic acid biosynthesis glycosyltransferase TuaC